MHYVVSSIHRDTESEATEGVEHSQSVDILTEAYSAADHDAWLSHALDSMDEPSSPCILAVSYAGGLLSARSYEEPIETDHYHEAETLDEDSEEAMDLPFCASFADEVALVSLKAALSRCRDLPGVDMVLVADGCGTLISGQENEDAEILAAFAPLFHNPRVRVDEMCASLTSELPQLIGRRIKIRFFDQDDGGLYVCAVGEPVCDLDHVIYSFFEEMADLLM